MPEPHAPVMPAEVLAQLAPRSGGFYVDATLGAGGHAALILEACSPGGTLLGLDRDQRAIELAGKRLAAFSDRTTLVRCTFDRLGQVLAERGLQPAQGILLDLGVSSMQLDDADRGFAFRFEAPLDMRMGKDGPSAAELLAEMDQDQLARAFKELGEESHSRRIARSLVQAREDRPIETTDRLANLVAEALPGAERRKRKLHPATQVFMALRIMVNDELGMLERFLDEAPALLAPGGRLAVLSYHSLEDRRVKKAMAAWADPCQCPPDLPVCACGREPLFTLPVRGALKPTAEEVAQNPRARSARLRVAQRTEVAA